MGYSKGIPRHVCQYTLVCFGVFSGILAALITAGALAVVLRDNIDTYTSDRLYHVTDDKTLQDKLGTFIQSELSADLESRTGDFVKNVLEELVGNDQLTSAIEQKISAISRRVVAEVAADPEVEQKLKELICKLARDTFNMKIPGCHDTPSG